jgi:hypothetical protein
MPKDLLTDIWPRWVEFLKIHGASVLRFLGIMTILHCCLHLLRLEFKGGGLQVTRVESAFSEDHGVI